MHVGWKSRFDIALGTRRRIVLHGNVMDDVLGDDDRPVELVEWLTRALTARGYARIVTYDLNEPPRVLRWESASGDIWRVTGSAETQSRDQDRVLVQLRRYLAVADVPSALILDNADLGVSYPSKAAVALHNVVADAAVVARGGAAAGTADGTLRNLAVHTYSRETLIPTEFVDADPDTRLVLVSLPSFEERVRYFRANQDRFFRNAEGSDGNSRSRVADSVYEPTEFARRTEGLRLRELRQLAELSRRERTDLENLSLLLSVFTFGRDEDRFVVNGTR
jgi:hypothetical protein